jgi:hypothetical protein
MTFKNPDFSANAPYYDDFQDTKNFLKILFKPGYAVQARELTQLQSILQSQVAAFADHIFQNGSQVFGGNIQIDETAYVRVEKNLYNLNGTASEQLTNTYFSNLPSNLLKVYQRQGSTSEYTELATIKVTYTEPASYSITDDAGILFYNVVAVAEGIASGTFEMQTGYYIGLIDVEQPILLKVITPQQSDTVPPQYYKNPFGTASLVTVDEGIFYVDGYFVKSEKQTVSLYKVSVDGESEKTLQDNIQYDFADAGIRLFNTPSHRIGYEVVRSVVTASEDETLKDPARGFYNYNAPGADRYKIELVLKAIEYNYLSVDISNYVNDDFIQVLRTTRGVVDYIKNKSSYSQILDLFARRTQDESGSYTVTPFLADVKNHLRKDKYVFTVNATSLNKLWELTQGTNNLLIKAGALIWNTSVGSTIDPFNVPSLDSINTAIGQVVDIIPDYNVTAGDNEARSIKLVVELLNNKKFGPVSGAGATYYLQQSISSNVIELTINAIDTQIDSKGAYSVVDLPRGDAEKLAITLQAGKAYIYGYEFETFAPRTLEYLNDANQTSIKTLKGLNVNYDLGNYVYGSFSERDPEQPSVIDYEVLPKFELVDKNVNTFLIYPSVLEQAQGRILSWSPFKAFDEFNKYNEKAITDMVDFDKIYENSEELSLKHPYESVIFVELD